MENKFWSLQYVNWNKVIKEINFNKFIELLDNKIKF